MPRSSERYSDCDAKYSRVCECGEMMNGESQFQRSGVPPFVLLRLDADALAGPLVEADDDAVLQLGVDGVRILGIDARDEAVAALGDEPVLVQDAVLGSRARRAAERVVVLQAAVDVVERRRVVDVDVVELRERQVLEEDPGARRGRTIDTARRRCRPACGLVFVGIDPDDVIVDVHVARAQRAQRLAAVVRHLEDHVRDVNAIDVHRIGEDVAVVHRAAGCSRVRFSQVTPSSDERKMPPLRVRRLDVGVQRRPGCTGEIASPMRPSSTSGSPVVTFFHVLPPSVLRWIALSGPAVDQREEVPPALIRRGDEHVRIARIDTTSVTPVFSEIFSTWFQVLPPSVVL